ncbi:ribosomal protein L15 [Lentisphaera araneosa HTCC2155]|jgi:large subunit ribosomal protein L15|uniref:Large ribosomal subunit protein uL15 n=1 Tax=Lentisphaera araneosa HTCC2155 TaxID=313628 RepID=A6DRC8_9BACT|nr:50S ribosomal protein L15 [Lentisphaera araneosa]EDM25875.1 ribosomal protein L15 [Lentisphaera araneosa HTCC2155]
MKLNTFNKQATAKGRKRICRGDGSGTGRTGGRGEKGQKSRSGSTIRPYFEGGQIPLFRRLPHNRGFKARNHKQWTIVNLSNLEEHFNAGDTVDGESLVEKKLIAAVVGAGLKVLANGEISKALTVKANKFSKTASDKIAAAGGTVEVV